MSPVTPPTKRLLVALDVDGTIMRADGEISLAVRAELVRVAALGHEVTLATGRPAASVIVLLDELGLTPDYAVCCNGAVLLRRAPDGRYDVHSADVFNPAAALRILRLTDPGAVFAVEDPAGEFLLTQRIGDFGTQSASRLVTFEDLLTVSALRVIVVSPDVGAPELIDQLHILGLRPVAYTVGRHTWLDIAPTGVDKARALERVRELLDIDRSDVVAIGDGANDLEMLRWAGEHGRGVALAHAPDEVRAAASSTTGSVEQDGAAFALATL